VTIPGRGVFIKRYLSDGGHRILVARDRNGRQVAECVIENEKRAVELSAAMWRVLEVADPAHRPARSRISLV